MKIGSGRLVTTGSKFALLENESQKREERMFVDEQLAGSHIGRRVANRSERVLRAFGSVGDAEIVANQRTMTVVGRVGDVVGRVGSLRVVRKRGHVEAGVCEAIPATMCQL